MNSSTTSKPKAQTKLKKARNILLATALWIFLWAVVSRRVNFNIVLPSPSTVLQELRQMAVTASFWHSIRFSLARVGIGFLLALSLGIVLAILAYRFPVIDTLLYPLLTTMKAAPVASYIIVCMFFMTSRNVPIFASFLMALPIVYQNILQGLKNTNPDLLEMAAVFSVPLRKKIVYIYFTELLPFLSTAASLSLGLCWKAGIAAEVITFPLGSIGEKLYQAKLYLDMSQVLAWTVVVILISFIFEKAMLYLLKKLERKVGTL